MALRSPPHFEYWNRLLVLREELLGCRDIVVRGESERQKKALLAPPLMTEPSCHKKRGTTIQFQFVSFVSSG
jgi:hypothetical protein